MKGFERRQIKKRLSLPLLHLTSSIFSSVCLTFACVLCCAALVLLLCVALTERLNFPTTAHPTNARISANRKALVSRQTQSSYEIKEGEEEWQAYRPHSEEIEGNFVAKMVLLTEVGDGMSSASKKPYGVSVEIIASTSNWYTGLKNTSPDSETIHTSVVRDI
jgi:hypothetical protein